MENWRYPAFSRSFWSFEKLLCPYDEDAFLRDTLSRSYLHVPGIAEKFSDLFGWPALNYILSGTAVRPPQLRITRGDVEEPSASYFRDSESGSFLHLPELHRLLLDGTVLTIDSVEEVHPPLEAVCNAIEAKLGITVSHTEAHATFSPTVGQEARWNDYDMFVLQCAGSRSWTIYGATKDRSGRDKTPPEVTMWSHTLEAGDFLYIPRNWWYGEKSFDTAALDVAIAFRNPTGMEITARVIEMLINSEVMTEDYPRFQSEKVQGLYLSRLQREIALAFAEPGLIRGYFNDVRALAAPRRLAGLPWSLFAVESLPGTCVIISTQRFSGPETRIRDLGGNFINIFCNGSDIKIDECFEPVLRAIFDEGACSIKALIDRFEKESSREGIMNLLSGLLKSGLVIAYNPVDSA